MSDRNQTRKNRPQTSSSSGEALALSTSGEQQQTPPTIEQQQTPSGEQTPPQTSSAGAGEQTSSSAGGEQQQQQTPPADTLELRALPFVLNRPRHVSKVGEAAYWARNEPTGKLTLAVTDDAVTITRPEVPEEREARAGKLPAIVNKAGVSIATPAEYVGSAGESFARIPFAAFGCTTPAHREALAALVVGLVVSSGRGIQTPAGAASGPVVDTATVKSATAKYDTTLQSGIMAARGAFAAHVLPTLPQTFAEARAAGAELTKACRKAMAVALADSTLAADARAVLNAGALLWGLVFDPTAKMMAPAPTPAPSSGEQQTPAIEQQTPALAVTGA